jgi:hypothetical protein
VVKITYSLRGANDDTITFDDVNYVLNPGMIGFGVAPTEVRVDPSVGVGGVFRNSRRAVRDLDLPITVLGSNRVDVQSKLRRLARITQAARGPMRLRAQYSTGEQLFLDLYYTGGAEGQWGDESGGLTWARWVLSCVAVQPYWESLQRSTFSIEPAAGSLGLLPELSKLQLSSSVALGSITVTSTADVPVFPVWTIEGPIDDATISGNGESFVVTGTIDTGDKIIVDTEKKTVVDGAGVNRYDLLAAAPKFFPFEPGENSVVVSGSNTGAGTVITADYALRFEVVH